MLAIGESLRYDKIAPLIDSLSTVYPKTFFIIQFKGNHGPYNNFRAEDNKFRPNPVYDKVAWTDHNALVNAYDNTVLFTDYNAYNVIKAIDKPGVTETSRSTPTISSIRSATWLTSLSAANTPTPSGRYFRKT